jgi:transcriptional regulator with XRE-family HTH domain
MNAKEYLNACKTKLNVDSNYKLSKKLEIKDSLINYYTNGERLPDVYACFRIAECLGLNPIEIIADIASESEKNPAKRDYFKRFMSACKAAVTGLMIIAVIGNGLNEEAALAG